MEAWVSPTLSANQVKAPSALKMHWRDEPAWMRAFKWLGLHKLGGKLGLTRRSKSWKATQLNAVREAEMRQGYRCVQSPAFHGVCSIVILLNAIYIGLNAQMEMAKFLEGKDGSAFFLIADILFSLWFLVEIIVRCIAGPWLWFFGPEWRWNTLDTVLVFFSVLDVLLSFQASFQASGGVSDSSPSSLSSTRILRLARFVRLLRLVHAVRIFHTLRIVVLGIVDSIKSMSWVFLVVVSIVYAFAVLFLQGVVEFVATAGADDPEATDLIDNFGDVFSGMLTLFMVITGGVDWSDVLRSLKNTSWFYQFVFILYVFLMFFAVLNVVIGAVVNSTADICHNDRDALVKSNQKRFEKSAKKLKEFFEEADVDNSGMLSWEEFSTHLESDAVKLHFQALEMEVAQARSLFKILDADGSDGVGLDEFVSGCMRLKNQAKGLDIRLLMYQNEIAFTRIKKSMDSTLGSIHQIEQRMNRMSAKPATGMAGNSSHT